MYFCNYRVTFFQIDGFDAKAPSSQALMTRDLSTRTREAQRLYNKGDTREAYRLSSSVLLEEGLYAECLPIHLVCFCCRWVRKAFFSDDYAFNRMFFSQLASAFECLIKRFVTTRMWCDGVKASTRSCSSVKLAPQPLRPMLFPNDKTKLYPMSFYSNETMTFAGVTRRVE